MKIKNKASGVAVAIATMTTLVATASVSHAFTIPTSDQYYNQLNGGLGLEYDTWLKFNGYINGEAKFLSDAELTPLNLDDLTWATGVNDVEVFFVNEGAQYHNKILFSADNRNTTTTIFEDASSANSIFPNGGPLALGQGVNIGSFSGLTSLSFLLQNPNGNVYGANASQNIDGIQHITAYKSNGYLVLGFEDLDWGGDRDYNDVVIAVRGMVDAEDDSADVPEPSSGIALLALGMVSWVGLRRQKKA